MHNLSSAEIDARAKKSTRKTLSINELSTLLERNKHKFIFYRYFGGMGGEFILNYLADNSSNIISQKDSILMQDFYMMGWDSNMRTANKFYFADTIFGHYFLYAGEKDISNEWATNFEELAEKILIDQEGISYGYPEHDFNSLFELDEHEDMRYLVKIHHFYDELKLFKGAKMINTAPAEWKKHCAMLCLAKNETNYVYTKKDKINRIDRLRSMVEHLTDDPFLDQHEYKSKKTDTMSIEKVNNYLSDIIENDEVLLYDNTILMALQPGNYDLDMSVIPAEEINNIETLQKLYFSEYMNEDDTDENMDNAGYLLTKTMSSSSWEEYYRGYEIIHYDYDDIANGEWVFDEFGLDAQEFRNAFDDWFNKNIEFLNNLGLHNHHIPKNSSYSRKIYKRK